MGGDGGNVINIVYNSMQLYAVLLANDHSAFFYKFHNSSIYTASSFDNRVHCCFEYLNTLQPYLHNGIIETPNCIIHSSTFL